jgi:inhibitor of KinA
MTDDSTPQAAWPRFLPSGDSAITVELGDEVDRRTNARVVRLHRHLAARPLPGMVETLPTFRSLLVSFDPRHTDPRALRDAIAGIIGEMSDEPLPSRRWTIPVCYDPEFGLDIAEVAGLSGMTPAQVVECQASVGYYVYMVGFLPGYAYLGDTPEPLRLPRRPSPRTRVPPGSLAIATGFASIYPFESPGGWHIIGRSPVRFFDTAAAEPALLAPGDEICFEPIGLDRYDALHRAGNARPRLNHGAAS